MTKLSEERKALRVIEWLVSDEFLESCEYKLEKDREFTQYEAKLLARKITDIYTFSHSVNPHICYSVHDDWREKLNTLYRKLQRHGEFRTFKEVTNAK